MKLLISFSLMAMMACILAPLPFASSPTCQGQDLTGETIEYGIPDYSVRPWLKSDATLRAITFVDPDRGWAVGDRGVILASNSGGDHWESQHSPTDATLFDVQFVNARRGLAVGGYYSSDTQTSRGVVLTTANGGRTWQRLDTDLPLLRSLRVQADGSILAAGDFSTVHMASVFLSDDGGRTWLAANAPQIGRTQCLTGPADGPTTVLGSDGMVHQFATVLQGGTAVLADANLRSLHGEAQIRVAVGTAGTLYISDDGGQRWTTIAAANTAEANVDYAAATEVDGVVYAVGSPGNRIRRIQLNGHVEDAVPPTHAALRDIHFYDSQRGWAIGAFGTILATRDAGQTWRVQRGGDRRAAILVVGQHAADVPWSVVAHESLERGRRVVVGTLAASQPASGDPLQPDPDTLTAQVACGLGGGETFTWRLDASSTTADSLSIQNALQTYRPRLLVLSATIDSDHRRKWIQLASQAGVQRVMEPTAKASSEWALHSQALLPRTGALLADLLRDAAAVLQSSGQLAEDQYFRRTFDALNQSGRAINDPLDGFIASGPAELRAVENATSRHALQILQARGGEARMVDRMLADGDRNGSFLLRFKLTLSQTPAENRMRLARRVLQGCRQSNQPRLYRQSLRVVVEQLPDTPLGQWASVRLNAVQHSSEWEQLDRATTRREQRVQSASTPVQLSPFAQDDAPTIRPAGAVADLVVTPDYTPSHVVGSPEQYAQDNQPDLVWDFDPRVVLIRNADNPQLHSLDANAAAAPLDPLTSAGSQRGHWKQIIRQPSLHAWGRLLDPSTETALAVRRTPQRPYLDGRLDEACWTTAAAWETPEGYTVRFAYDAQHMYWSATGPGPEHGRGTPTATPQRTRDAKLDDVPRLTLKIDTNGDLATAFGLEVDRLGRTRDTCDGFSGWQPMWFVDTHEADGRWTVEAAIRRTDLSPLPPVVGSHWNVSVQTWQEDQDAWRQRLPRCDDWHAVQFQ
ncbi:YCF48-related protein [Roseimaritima ulvae]|uniref:Ycf48-like protein n=1 Tax=Roseimaritima ulvae TaxID=980254 RepID=A0A5B9R6C3_9BACT|nr:YCF48-related protein [Roseimaritima ulvae]QEG41813.1 Ycf48-like protein precursor [Roseimaritima ulvae]